MSPVKSACAGLAVGLIAYFVVGNIGASKLSQGDSALALIGTEVSPSLSPSATEVTNRVTKSITNLAPGAKAVSPSLSPGATSVSPSPAISVTPRVSALVAPTASPTVSVTPRPSVTPNPTPTSSPTPSPTPTTTPLVTPTPTPAVGTSRVVINEIAWAGTAFNASDEWVELYNAGDTAVDVTGWSLHGDPYGDGDTIIIVLSGVIAPGAYYLVERTDDTTVSDIIADVFGPFGGAGLKNLPGGEDLSLRNAGGVIVDSIPCSSGWFAGGAPLKATMERVDPLVPGSDLANWASNTDLITTGLDAAGNHIRGTPKFRNSVTP